MNPLVSNILTFAGVVLAATIPAFIVYKQATKVARISAAQATEAARMLAAADAKKADAEAFQRAKEIYESGIQELEQHIGRLRKLIDEERDANDKLRLEVRELERTVLVLRQQLIRAGIAVNEELGTEFKAD